MNSWIEIRNIRNLTADTDVTSSGEVVEFSANTLVLQLPEVKLNVGSLVSVKSILHLQATTPVEFNVIGKVISTGGAFAGDGRTSVELRQFDKNLWQVFLDNTEQAQKKVEALFQRMKGDPRE